jgi:hypothetical protein
MADMDEILRSGDRAGRVFELTVIFVAAVSAVVILAGAALGVLIASRQAPWAVLAGPGALEVAAVITAVRVQDREARRHKRLCTEYRTGRQ